jgi:hypothetical protein
MNITNRQLVLASLLVCATLGLTGISTTAVAGGWFSPSPQLYSAICQSYQTEAGNSEYAGHDCGSGGDGTAAILVPLQKYFCFYLTDFTATNNNGARQVALRNGNGGSRAFPPSVDLASAYNGNITQSNQDWTTPIVFTSNLWVDVQNPNNNVIITVSGYYDRCPLNINYPATP